MRGIRVGDGCRAIAKVLREAGRVSIRVTRPRTGKLYGERRRRATVRHRTRACDGHVRLIEDATHLARIDRNVVQVVIRPHHELGRTIGACVKVGGAGRQRVVVMHGERADCRLAIVAEKERALVLRGKGRAGVERPTDRGRGGVIVVPRHEAKGDFPRTQAVQLCAGAFVLVTRLLVVAFIAGLAIVGPRRAGSDFFPGRPAHIANEWCAGARSQGEAEGVAQPVRPYL